MVNPQTPGLQMTHHLKRGRVASDHTLFQSLCAPLFPPFSKGEKDSSGLVPWAKVPDRYPEELSPLWLSFSQDEQKENGDSEEIISLSLPPPHFPLLSLSLSLFPQLSLSFSLYREPGTGHHAWKQLTIFSCLQVFSPKLRVFWFWLAGFFVFELRLFRFFRFPAEDAWFFLNSRLLLFSIFRSPWYCIAFYKL